MSARRVATASVVALLAACADHPPPPEWQVNAKASLDLAKILYEDVLNLRLDSAILKPVAAKSGFIAGLKAKTFRPAGEASSGLRWDQLRPA